MSDRPIRAVVSMDPAGVTGTCGLALLPAPGVGGSYEYYSGGPMKAATFRWVGDRVASVCRPGDRVLFVSENNAYGGTANARKLGIGIGAVEGLLVDLNAIPENSRVDVATGTWRPGVGIVNRGRSAAKAHAIKLARPYTGGVDISADAAEALHIGRFIHTQMTELKLWR